MVELNPTFAAYLRGAFERRPPFRAVAARCHLIEGSVQELGSEREFDVVLSGLPLNNFSPADVRAVLEAYSKLLKSGGILSFFQYIFIRDAKALVSIGSERARLRDVGAAIDGVLRDREFAREWIWPNVPPAWVHHLRF